MDGSDMGFSSSTNLKPSAIPKFSTTDLGETDENNQSHDIMASKLHNPPKKPPMKHFMSPTISAASKAAAPRKKILAERNEAPNFADTHHLNTPNLDSKAAPLSIIHSSDRSSPRVTSVHSRVYESEDDEQNHSFVSDSSSRPYDPLTNYLSPRPKFLRYKPNRRCEIFLGQENEIGKEKNGSGVKRSSVSFDSQKAIAEADSSTGEINKKVPSPQEDSVKQEDGEIRNSNADDDEDDDGTDEETVEGFRKETCLSLKGVLKFVLVCVILYLSTIYISSMNSLTPSPMPEPMWGLKDGYHKIHNHTLGAVNFKVSEGRSGSLGQRKGIQIIASDNGFEEELMVEENNNGLVESAHELGDVVVVIENGESADDCDHELNEEVEEVSEQKQITETENGEVVGDAESEKKEEVSVGFQQEQTAEREEVHDLNLEKTREGSPYQLMGIETSESREKSESLQVEGEDNTDTSEGISEEGAEKELVENEVERVEGITENADGDVNSVKVTIKRGIALSPVGIMGMLIITALTYLVPHWRRKKTSVKQSLSTRKPFPESVLAEKISSPVHYVEEGQIDKVDSFVNPSSLIHSTEETNTKDLYRSRAPKVELLGEFVVGEVSYSTIKSCTMKSKMMENEVSSHPGFQEKGMGSKAHVVSTSQGKPSASEFSTMNSPSYGSFTAEKKIVRKEEGKDGEVKMVLTTPVRRSSRIRNRGAMSP